MKIGLTYTGREEKHNNYVQWLKNGEDIEVIKLSPGNNAPASYDALVLSGGLDTHPRFYNGNIDYLGKPENWNEQRDEHELLLLKDAFERSIPVLGICRGLQLINIYQGGNLFQDISEENDIHPGGPDQIHLVNIQKNTLLSEITGIDTGEFVNSAHHQSVDKMGEGLRENSRSDDSIIEGIEWIDKNNKPFLLGVQWHPERMNKFGLENSPLSKNIRDFFIKAIKKNKNK